jgi:hypothetical protein
MTAPSAPARPQETRHRNRPTTEYWDVFTASWRRPSPAIPAPRDGN